VAEGFRHGGAEPFRRANRGGSKLLAGFSSWPRRSPARLPGLPGPDSGSIIAFDARLTPAK
jgi:hypothetical protein